ncbi:radical SAM protein [Enhygromyxa salina]|uniref:Molybdenum cofactor biosynthesis protein A n=1 Tax=Enhygromyxa salina TaxID=215803 RepID=A0A2S9XWX0_9BACT|nr:radical SAM protein [Enhygromyxa salina]PRP97343.1 molybdenum cofactor biosynthesis protein A [Enhygromyxa salina]
MGLETPERVSLELSRRCAKACGFCYNASEPSARDEWHPDEVIGFARSLVRHGTKALSLGGGEPLQYEGLGAVFAALRGAVFLSMTSNGLLLDEQIARVSKLNPDKLHISIHYPARTTEVTRVIRQVRELRRLGIRSGVNLLVRRSELDEASSARAQLWGAGIHNDAIMFLPMRGTDTPTPADVARVAGAPFQSMTCLSACGPSPRFCSVGADKTVGHCSYTVARRRLPSLDAAGLVAALDGLGLSFCGDTTPLMPAQSLRRRGTS